MAEQIIKPLTEDLEGYVRFYAYDCSLDWVKDSERF
jgi:hypothetical protein